MSFWVTILVISASQFVFVLLRTYQVRVINAENIFMAMLVTLGVQITWLVGTSLGVNSLLNGDFWVVLAYLVSGVLGTWAGLKIKA